MIKNSLESKSLKRQLTPAQVSFKIDPSFPSTKLHTASSQIYIPFKLFYNHNIFNVSYLKSKNKNERRIDQTINIFTFILVISGVFERYVQLGWNII